MQSSDAITRSLPTAPVAVAPMPRQGRAARLIVRSAAILLYGEGLRANLRCTIENRSATGALLMLDPGAALPAKFVIVDWRSRICSTARLVWRKGAACGVQLIATFELKPREAAAVAPASARPTLTSRLDETRPGKP